MSLDRNSEDKIQDTIEKLRAIIQIESSKPANEMDADLIDECVDHLMELEDLEDLTSEQIDKNIAIIINKIKNNSQPKKNVRFKALLVAACVAIVLLIANVVAMAFGINSVSVLKQLGNSIIEMFSGEKVEYNEITVIKENGILSFSNFDEFREKTGLDILYPYALPQDAELNTIILTGTYDKENRYTSEYHDVHFVTNNQNISVIVHTHPDFYEDYSANCDLNIKKISEYNCYTLKTDLGWQGTFVYGDATYVISTETYEDLVMLIVNLKEYA